jgi:hypothetical protein
MLISRSTGGRRPEHPRSPRRLAATDRAAGPLLQASGKGLALEERHDDEVRAAGFADIEDSADVGMIEGGDDPRLALEPDAGDGIARHVRRQQFDRNAAIEPRVTGPVDLAHATSADRGDDLVGPETNARFDGHHSPVYESTGFPAVSRPPSRAIIRSSAIYGR